ncbi:uncharacterized protein LOC105196792 [Solenopsis invicta]|uniref:uncharacterized protein LOC105196792 n=1 Tax=Solenopsis invicta TaxID=13686 RepID=UPI00193CE673|nr:uncharacterized protein LOC105196792 [Solenopsis invicta]
MIPAMINTLKLDLERKKKSEERTFLGSCDSPSSSSSSGDEQLANDEENERARQKGGEESDGRRPMAEQERKVSDGNNEELLLPWKVEVREEIQPRTLIEEISGSEQYIADAERKCHGKQILDNCKSTHDPLSVCIADKKTATCRKVALESQIGKEQTVGLQESINDNNETNDRKNEGTSICSVSCDTSDLNQILEENYKLANAVTNVTDDVSSKNIKSYPRKSKEYPFGSKLSSIREEMREFYDSMDRFVDENKIVFKNGEVEGFWGERKMVDENLQTDFTDDSKIQENETKVSASEENKLRWWSTKERKLKVGEILKNREDEAKKNKIETEDAEINDKSNSEDKKQSIDTTDNFQDVYDLMTLKTHLPCVLPDSTETYSGKQEENYECEQPTKKEQEKSHGVFNSLLAELRNRDCVQKVQKPKVSTELMVLEKKLNYEKSAVDTEKTSAATLFNVKDLVDSDEHSSKCENIIHKDYSAKIEILQDKVNTLSFESSEEKKSIDESDDDSFKTATSVQEDSQISESISESSEILKLNNKENNFDKIIELNSTNNENVNHLIIDNSKKEIILNTEHNDATCVDEEINDKSEKSSDKVELLKIKRQFPTEIKESNSYTKSLVQTMDRLSLEKTSHSSRLIGKRTREAEDIAVSNKKSFLIEEINSGRKQEERKSRSQISERCRQHLLQETKKFTKKVSPLIDKCITNLIKETENTDVKSQYNKYERRSLGEYLPSSYVSKMDFGKHAGDVGEQDNYRDKCGSKSNDVTNASSEKQELTMGQTINLESTTSANYSDTQSLAKLLRQSENCKPESSAINFNASYYKEFCDHLHELESKKKSLIKPDFMIKNHDSKELLSDNKLLQNTECSIKKPSIEVISECSTACEDSKEFFKQKEIKEQLYSPQTTSHCQQKNVALRESEEMTEISDNFEKYINQENAINLKEGIKIETFSTSCSVEITECKEDCTLSNEELKPVANMKKKSIEMQVAQEN